MSLLEDALGEAQGSAPVLIGVACSLCGLMLASIVLRLARLWFPASDERSPAWEVGHLVQVLLLGLASVVLVPVGWVAVFGKELAFVDNLILMALVLLIPGLWVVTLARRLHPQCMAGLGFRLAGSLRAACFGVLAYVLLIPLLVGAMLLWPSFLEWMGQTPRTQDVMRGFFELRGEQLILPVLFAVLIVPFFEELLFRAFLQPFLVRHFRAVGAVIATSLVFAGLHGLSALGPVFVLSLIMGGVMQKTRRFLGCFAVHALHNGLTIWAILSFDEVREMVDVGALPGLLELFQS